MIIPTDIDLQIMEAIAQSTPEFTGNDSMSYDKYTVLNRELWSSNKKINDDIEDIASQIREDTISDNGKYRKHLLVILTNLFVAHATRQGQYVAYSRARNHYSTQSRYNAQKLSHRYMTSVVDQLEAHGYIEHVMGFHDRRNPKDIKSKQSRMRATSKLMKVFAGWSENDIRRHPHAETIILKDKNKNIVDYERDTRAVATMRKRLDAINTMLAEADIKLNMTPAEKAQLYAERQRNGKSRINYWQKSLFRIFSNGKFTQGGRFYGGWWEVVNGDIRSRITINGQPTAEKDFKALHPSMLYIRETGALPSLDPYQIDGEGTDKLVRKVAKSLLLIMINSKAGKSIKDAFLWNMDRSGKFSIEERNTIASFDLDAIIAKIKERNKAIASHFSSNAGVKLQYEDSQIIERVMANLMKQGIVSLPVHDSLVVEARYEAELIEAMREAFMWKLDGVEPVIT